MAGIRRGKVERLGPNIGGKLQALSRKYKAQKRPMVFRWLPQRDKNKKVVTKDNERLTTSLRPSKSHDVVPIHRIR